MARPESLAANRIAEMLRAPDGIAAACAQLLAEEENAIRELTGDEVVDQYVPADLADKSASIRYPTIHVYCERLVNKLREKFRTFSGTATIVVDVRTSHEHIEDLQTQLQVYVGSVTEVLHRKRGSVADGLFYSGGYEVVFSPVKRGGKNYLQSAQVRLELQISVN